MNKDIVNTMSFMKNICFSIYSYTKVIKKTQEQLRKLKQLMYEIRYLQKDKKNTNGRACLDSAGSEF